VTKTRTRKRHRPLAVFRLYPESTSRLYCRVVVWPTLEAMKAASTWERQPRHTKGFCAGFKKQRYVAGRWRTDPVFAEIHLARNWLQTRIITHEILHATYAWGRRIRFPWTRLGNADAVNQDEERTCYAHGEMVRQFVDRAYRAGLY
jgi:hypothetical protein